MKIFPLGTHVYREPHQDQDELMSDLPILKKLGFNMIKIQEHWSIDEPREGYIDLSRIERLITRADELGLGIYLGLTMEQAPAWLWKKYPDARFVYANGQPHNDPTQYCLPSDGKPGPCWDHPGARSAAERFIGELAKRLGSFKNIWAWNTWQEIGFWPNDGGVLGFCYCPNTLRSFREWLQKRYTSLESLNQRWQTGFGYWEEVEPPRRNPTCPITIDWRYFMDDVYLTRVLEWKTRALRDNDPYHRPVFSHVATPSIGSGGEWRWAKVADFFGNSNYPAWWSFHGWDDASRKRSDPHITSLQQIWDGIQMRTDYIRCAAGPERIIWGAEFQGGPISTNLHRGKDPDAEDIRRWMLSGLAAGMNGISFWNHRCEISWSECNGFGLLDPSGQTTERIEEVGRIVKAINQDPDIFSQGRPPRAEVAILINQDLYHFCQATGDNALGHLQYSIRGHYYRLWKMGIAADFVEAEEVVAGSLKEYKMAILPVPLALDPDYFSHISKFVENGGTLVSEACPGRFDKYGFCPRSQMVHGGESLFGVRHKDVRIVREPEGEPQLWTPGERGFGEFLPPIILNGIGDFSGTRLRASFYLQTLDLINASSILMSGNDVAGAINSFGQGKAILIGTFAGHSALAHQLNEPEGVFEKIAKDAGVKSDMCGRLIRRRRIFEDKQAWFLINPAREEVLENISLDGFTFVRDLLGDSVTEIDVNNVKVVVPGGNLACLIVSSVNS